MPIVGTWAHVDGGRKAGGLGQLLLSCILDAHVRFVRLGQHTSIEVRASVRTDEERTRRFRHRFHLFPIRNQAMHQFSLLRLGSRPLGSPNGLGPVGTGSGNPFVGPSPFLSKGKTPPRGGRPHLRTGFVPPWIRLGPIGGSFRVGLDVSFGFERAFVSLSFGTRPGSHTWLHRRRAWRRLWRARMRPPREQKGRSRATGGVPRG